MLDTFIQSKHGKKTSSNKKINGMIYVYKDRGVNGNLEICKKKSFYWYKKFIVNNTKILRNRKGLFDDIMILKESLGYINDNLEEFYGNPNNINRSFKRVFKVIEESQKILLEAGMD